MLYETTALNLSTGPITFPAAANSNHWPRAQLKALTMRYRVRTASKTTSRNTSALGCARRRVQSACVAPPECLLPFPSASSAAERARKAAGSSCTLSAASCARDSACSQDTRTVFTSRVYYNASVASKSVAHCVSRHSRMLCTQKSQTLLTALGRVPRAASIFFLWSAPAMLSSTRTTASITLCWNSCSCTAHAIMPCIHSCR